MKDYRMSSDNQLQFAAPVMDPAQESVSKLPNGDADKVYKMGTLLIAALVYTVYISPVMRARALTEKTPAIKAAFRWVDLLTKLLLVYLIAYAATCNATITIVITLVFLLFATQDRDNIVIESNKLKNKNMIENMTGDEEDLDEGEDIDYNPNIDTHTHMHGNNSFEFERTNGNIIFESDKPVFFPLNSGSMDPELADDIGDLHPLPTKISGMIVDTIAESEKIANAQGLGMGVLDKNDESIHDDDIGKITGFGDLDSADCTLRYEEFKNEKSEENETSADSQVVSDTIENTIEQVADEVKVEKNAKGEDVNIPPEAKDEVRKAITYVTAKMDADCKVITGHDILMVCRMIYGQMFRCDGLIKSVIADAKTKEDNEN